MKSISLIIPVKNEAKTIQALVDSIAAQSVLPAEAIFVDGGSTDATRDIIRANCGRFPFEIVLIETEKAYPGEARNIGIKKSRNETVAFTDAGIRLDRRWLEELARPMDIDESVEVVYGAYEPVTDSFIKWCSLIAYVPPKEQAGGKLFRTNFIASSLFKKYVCEKAGLFPPFRAAEDRIFMENVAGIGAKAAYTDKAVVYWEIPDTISGIFRRFCEFSYHDIAARRARDWHRSVARTYLIFAASLLLGMFVTPVFYLVIPAVWVVRIANIYRKRESDLRPVFVLDPRYIATISFIVFVTDLALLCGSIRYAWKRG